VALRLPVEHEARRVGIDACARQPLDRGSGDERAGRADALGTRERHVLHPGEAFVVGRRLELAERAHLEDDLSG
jgi:hypothetical protein